MNKVLLVEDSAIEAQKITQSLEESGYAVYGVRSSEEAVLRLKQQKPNLIVLDVILPGQSGFELCRQLKADPVTKTIPIVICSSKNSDVDKTWGTMSGADAYITKPVDIGQLNQTVSRLIK